MSAGKFTPGPWRLGKSGGSVVADFPVPEMNGSDATDYYGGHLIAESITPSNARLIAAAPEILEALLVCIDTLDRIQEKYGVQTSAEIVAREAIAKATTP